MNTMMTASDRYENDNAFAVSVEETVPEGYLAQPFDTIPAMENEEFPYL